MPTGNAGPAQQRPILEVVPEPQPPAHPPRPAVHVHPVKTERHDTLTHMHSTNTGERPVEVYRETAGGLYVSRAFTDHPRVAHWQAHLLPGVLGGGVGLQLCRYDFHGERDHDYYIYYVDVVSITRRAHIWTVRDHYLDVLVWNNLSAEVVDQDELDAALGAGYIGLQEHAAAMAAARRVLDGLAGHGYDLERWLDTFGVRLAWDERAGAKGAELV